MTLERHWPPETAESLKTGYGGLESRWKWVWSEADDWGKLLEIVLPEMERFQVSSVALSLVVTIKSLSRVVDQLLCWCFKCEI